MEVLVCDQHILGVKSVVPVVELVVLAIASLQRRTLENPP